MERVFSTLAELHVFSPEVVSVISYSEKQSKNTMATKFISVQSA